tara:strand:- start:94 stop:384 length:291 start_codon:yes stop_codon:yes gene_type:complete
MKTKFYFLLFPLTLFSSINPLFAKSDDNAWYSYGFHVGSLVQTCKLAEEKSISTKVAREELEFRFYRAKTDLDSGDYRAFTNFAYEDMKECSKFLP